MTTTSPIGVLAPDGTILDALGPIPDNVELMLMAPGAAPTSDQLDAEVVILGGELAHLVPRFGEFDRLRVIQTLSAGIDRLIGHIPDGVTLCNGSGVHDTPVAEWVLGVMLALRREFPRFHDAQRAGRWDETGNALTTHPDDMTADDLEGARVLIIGYGSIGRRVEEMLGPFGAHVERVALHERPGVRPPSAIDDLLPTSDVVVVLAPLTPETVGLLDERRLDLLPDGAIVINGARGGLIDHAALERRLRSGQLRAALDATDPEPLPPGSTLWHAPGVIVTPHVAGSSKKWMLRAYRFAGDQLRRYAAGEPLQNVRSNY